MFVYYYVFSSVFLVVNPCGTNPCFNGGTCAQSTSDCNQYVCLCPACYTGQTCSTCKIQTDKMKWLYLWLGWLHAYLVISPDFKRCVILTLWVHQVFCIQTYIKHKWGNALMALGYHISGNLIFLYKEGLVYITCVFPMIIFYSAINVCDSSPCMNGGTCLQSGQSCDSFFCQCPDCFNGEQCLQRKSSP